MSFYGWKPYVTAAERRAKAEKKAAKLAKSGHTLTPIRVEGRGIARTFWGKGWCDHIESFSDYENRLPRGRTYARNGSIIDLQIEKGTVSALVMGSSLYEVRVAIKPLDAKRWVAIKSRTTGQIDSLVSLLQGRFSDAVMRVVTDRDAGLFPAPAEIEKTCSCPDWAGLCKHLAAVLYGVGARLDEKPELLFLLRGVDHLELLDAAPHGPVRSGAASLDSEELADVFGIDISPSTPAAPVRKAPRKKTRKKSPQPATRAVGKKAAKPKAAPRPTRAKKPARPAAKPAAKKRRPPVRARRTRKRSAL